MLAKGELELALAKAGDGGELLIGQRGGEVGLDMALHLEDAGGKTWGGCALHPLPFSQQGEPHLLHARHLPPLGHHAVQKSEVVALGLIQLDKGAEPPDRRAASRSPAPETKARDRRRSRAARRGR